MISLTRGMAGPFYLWGWFTTLIEEAFYQDPLQIHESWYQDPYRYISLGTRIVYTLQIDESWYQDPYRYISPGTRILYRYMSPGTRILYRYMSPDTGSFTDTWVLVPGSLQIHESGYQEPLQIPESWYQDPLEIHEPGTKIPYRYRVLVYYI
jgi:hypothetical protein